MAENKRGKYHVSNLSFISIAYFQKNVKLEYFKKTTHNEKGIFRIIMNILKENADILHLNGQNPPLQLINNKL